MPLYRWLTPKPIDRPSAAELDCVAAPMPKEARKAKTAKITASHFCPAPCSRMYMVPPRQSPWASFCRKWTARVTSANLVHMPKKAEISIQTSAPGPPRCRAVDTPAMLPVPTVAAMAVAIAAKEEIDLSASLAPRADVNTSFMAATK